MPTNQLCECGHVKKEHKRLIFASGIQAVRCGALGTDRRPIVLGSKTMCRHWNCPCRIDITPKAYTVWAMDTRSKEKFWIGEYYSKEEAEEKRIDMNIGCDDAWCDHHKHWIEETGTGNDKDWKEIENA